MSDKTTTKAKKRRGRNALTFYEKIAVIRHHEANQMSRNSLARMFQCCTTQVRRILENREELLAQWEAMSETNASMIIEEMNRKRREFEGKAVGFILHQWVERCRQLQLNMVINDDTLRTVALKTATVLNLPELRPTARWIEKFRSKFKYKDVDLANPRSSDDPQDEMPSVEDIIIEYKHYLPSFMQQEISNITSNSLRDGSSGWLSDGAITSEHGDESLHQMPADNVLQHLSVIQQFSTQHADYRALALIEQLGNHIRENYATSETQTEIDDGDDIILVE